MKKATLIIALSMCVCLSFPAMTLGQATITLPDPQITGGKPLMQALKERRSKRSYSTKKLPPQVLSNLLWAAYGVNRPAAGLHTTPTIHNAQEIIIYVSLEEGLYRYEPRGHTLDLVLAEDIRLETAIAPHQGYTWPAPLNLVYVTDLNIMPGSVFGYEDTGSICQNVYLYCASEGLSTVVRGAIPDNLAEIMELPDNEHITLLQTVGYPAGTDPNEGRDVNNDGVVEVSSEIMDMDGDGKISAGDTYTNIYEDGSSEIGITEQSYIDWLLANGFTLDAFGLQEAANSLKDDLRHWTDISIVQPSAGTQECLQCHAANHFSGNCLECHVPHPPQPTGKEDPYKCLECHIPHLFSNSNCLSCHEAHPGM
jgi:nitroreductase